MPEYIHISKQSQDKLQYLAYNTLFGVQCVLFGVQLSLSGIQFQKIEPVEIYK